MLEIRIAHLLALVGACSIATCSGRALDGLNRAARLDRSKVMVANEPTWIKRLFARELVENATAISELCFEGHMDLGREIRGVLRESGPPLGPEFSAEDLADFPYAKQGYCDSINSSLRFEPDDCILPDFEPLELLEQIRGHRLVFWGDSIMRQFFSYVSLRLRSYERRKKSNAGQSGRIDFADLEVCTQYDPTEPDNVTSGFGIDPRCFDLAPGNLDRNCLHYLEGEAAICYIRVEKQIIDARNVIYWNALESNDILLLNTGLHQNTRTLMAKQLQVFAHAVHYYNSNYHKLPLMLWRETSAQHFDGGEAGNFPHNDEKEKERLRHVKEGEFNCSSYSHEDMVNSNFRNNIVREQGFRSGSLRVLMPVLKVWNVTSMAFDQHPRTLGGRTKEADAHATADCTHFCPSFGGIYEIWATLLQNFLYAAQPLKYSLRPKLITDNSPQDDDTNENGPGQSASVLQWPDKNGSSYNRSYGEGILPQEDL